MNKNEVLDLEIETSTLCQAECPLCYRNYKVFKDVYPKMIQRELSELKEQLEEFTSLDWIRLVGTISEPTLYKDFLELCSYIKKRNIKIEICTNGDTHNEAWWIKLAEILNEDDEVYFTICGSTQELHETYRKGTNLNNILNNAKALRTKRAIDYAQCIKFDYNEDDFNSENFKKVTSNFTNVYMTETFLKKEEDNYVNQDDLEKLKPNSKKIESYLTIERIADQRKENGTTNCKSLEDKSQIMDVQGRIYPCYLYMEAMNGEDWDGDYEKIKNLEKDVCKFCEKNVVRLLENADLTYII